MIKNYLKQYRWLIVLFAMTLVFNSIEIVEEYDKDEIIRFHVLADNDSPKSQQDKLAVKDAVVSFMQVQLAQSQSIAESRRIIQENMMEMKKIAQNTLSERNNYDNVQIQYGNYYFPVKYYGAFALPAGEYEAVRIVLGEGKGQNWWCVMFPPMCFTGASDDLGAYSDCAPKKEIVVKFKVVEYWREKFGEN